MKPNAAAHGMVLKPREGVSSEPVQNTVMRHVNGIWLNLLCFVVFFNFFSFHRNLYHICHYPAVLQLFVDTFAAGLVLHQRPER